MEHSFFEHNTAVSVAQWPCSRTTRLPLVGILFEYPVTVFVCVGTCTAARWADVVWIATLLWLGGSLSWPPSLMGAADRCGRAGGIVSCRA